MLKFIKILPQRREFSFLSDGDSMLPILQSGDLVSYKRISFNRVRHNDILLVRKNKRLFTHRVIYKTNAYLVTKGDNNLRSDGKIPPENVIAKAYRIKRGKKTVGLDELYMLQSLLYFHEISRILKALKINRVDVLVLKGLPLHLFYEGVRPKRIYNDCDVLVTKKDVQKLSRIMTENGYRKIDKSLSKEHRWLKNKHVEDSYIKFVGKFPVIFDVHYEAVFMMTQLGKLDALYPQSLIDGLSRKLLREKQEVSVEGKRFPILSDVNAILYLMLHFFHHNYEGIHRLELVHRIMGKVRDKKTLYHELFGSIQKYKLSGYLYPGFIFLMRYCATPLSPRFLDAIRPPLSQIRYIDRSVLTSSLFDGEGRLNDGIKRFKNLFYLSPGHYIKKSMVFFNPSVLFSLVFIAVKKITHKPVTHGPDHVG